MGVAAGYGPSGYHDGGRKLKVRKECGVGYYSRAGDPISWKTAMDLYADMDSRRVALTDVVLDGVEVRISTVHLILDHSYGDGPPIIFETMVFGLTNDLTWRYPTEEAALAGHDRVVATMSDHVSQAALAAWDGWI